MRQIRAVILRYRDGWACKRVAEELGVKPSAVSRWTTGTAWLNPYIWELKRRAAKKRELSLIVGAMEKGSYYGNRRKRQTRSGA